MRSPESTRYHTVLNLLPIAGAISGGVLAYASGLSEFWATSSQSVGHETWKALPADLQKIAFEGLRISSSCAYGTAVGMAIDKTIDNWEGLSKQAVKLGLVDKFFKYHPSNYLSLLR